MAFTQQQDGSITDGKGKVVVTKEGEQITPEVEKSALEKAQDEIARLKGELAKGKAKD